MVTFDIKVREQPARWPLLPNVRVILASLGTILMFFAGILIVPLLVTLFYEAGLAPDRWQQEIRAFVFSIIISFVTGFLLRMCGRGLHAKDLTIRDGFAVVALSWAFLALFGALPFYLSGEAQFASFTDSYFETISGLTTTGSSILNNIEALPNGLLFWRSMTHWLGGVGVVVLVVAILPALGIGGYNLYRAETPGPTKERLSPRIAETAKILWGVYLLLTVAQTLLLLPSMNLFEALCQTFGTLATGGFSTRNQSIAGFDSLYVEIIITTFMFLAGINFILHYQMLRGNFTQLYKDRQARFYTALMAASVVLITISVYFGNVETPTASRQYYPADQHEQQAHVDLEREKVATLPGALRHTTFTVVSITTTTGYATADFDLWPDFSRLLLVMLMFVGASAGSTTGSLKVVRIILLIKFARREIEKMVRRRAILPVKYAGAVVADEVLNNVVSLFILYLGIFAVATLIMTLFIPDILSSAVAVAANLGCVGPGLGMVGPTQNYQDIAPAGKWILSLCMLLGRLEIYSVLIILLPGTWRR